jgi:hypothetical protein
MLADGLTSGDPVGIEMIVARQFTAWERQRRTVPSRRDGVSCPPQAGHRPEQERDFYKMDHTSPTGRPGFVVHIPGSELPGDLCSVPSGLMRPRSVLTVSPY